MAKQQIETELAELETNHNNTIKFVSLLRQIAETTKTVTLEYAINIGNTAMVELLIEAGDYASFNSAFQLACMRLKLSVCYLSCQLELMLQHAKT